MAIEVRDICSVFKLRIAVAIAASALAGVAVTQGPFPAWRAALLALGVLGASAAAGAFNQYIERDIDARMARTRTRPFARGAFAARPEWLWGLALLLAASVAAAALAGGMLSAGKPTDALTVAKAAEEMAPKSVAVATLMARVRQALGHRVEAIAAYAKAIELSDTPRALPMLTQAIRELSDLSPKSNAK